MKKKIINIINPKDIYIEICERCGSGTHKVKDCIKIPNPIGYMGTSGTEMSDHDY